MAPRNLRVPKRRVAAEVRLADDTVLAGLLYTDVERLDGSPGCVADRLEDPLGRYLPIAVDDRHVLINKAGIVTVRVPEQESRRPSAKDVMRMSVRVRMSNNEILEGELYAILPPARARVLDFLNMSHERFIQLFQNDRLTLINGDYIVEVTELLADEG